MTRVSPPRLLIVVDTHVPERTIAAHGAVERAIAMAASLIDRMLEDGLSVGLLVWSGEWRHVPPARGKRHNRELLAVLARLPLNASHDRRALLERARTSIHSGITPVLFTPGEIEMNLSEFIRGHWVAIAAGSDDALRWFHFRLDINFDACMPPDQQPPQP